MKQYDILIIGAGAVGSAVARELRKNGQQSVGVLEKEPDVAFGISGRNSGVLHAGFNNRPGSLMAKLCVLGSEGFPSEAENMGIRFQNTGKLVIARHEEDLPKLQKLKDQGEANGVRKLKIIERSEFQNYRYEGAGIAGLWSGMTGIFDPFEYTTALAGAAVAEGAEFLFGRQALTIEKREYGFEVTAENRRTGEEEAYRSEILINSAGLSADDICRMAGIQDYQIYPCRGEYHILDKRKSGDLAFPVYPVPNETEGGLGVHLTPTIHGNLMIGPSAEYLIGTQEREDYATSRSVMEALLKEGADLLPGIRSSDCIRSFAGIRPKLTSKEQGGYSDFVVRESSQVPGLIELIGIESPGLTSSIPIAGMVASILREKRPSEKSPAAKKSKKEDPSGSVADTKDPGSQRMVCLCESITEQAVLNAYDQICRIGAVPTIKGIKNRARVTMGSCQGSFCTPQIVDLLAKKRDVDPMELNWNGFGSRMFSGRVRK